MASDITISKSQSGVLRMAYGTHIIEFTNVDESRAVLYDETCDIKYHTTNHSQYNVLYRMRMHCHLKIKAEPDGASSFTYRTQDGSALLRFIYPFGG